MTVSFDEAKNCPKCGEPGEERQTTDLGHKGKAIVFHCMNQLCLWYETGYVVQVLPDGSIHESRKGESLYPALSPGQEAMARRVLEDLQGQDLRETGPGTR